LTRGDGQAETSPSSEPPSDTARRPLADEQVVARGEFGSKGWRLYAQPFENGLVCLERTEGGGHCGGVPTAAPLGPVSHTWDSIEGSRFVFGAVVREAAEVRVELANGEELSVEPSQQTFGIRFFVVPIRAVTVLDEEGRELERLDFFKGAAGGSAAPGDPCSRPCAEARCHTRQICSVRRRRRSQSWTTQTCCGPSFVARSRPTP
jgi:hypothetical protein